eukprot:1153421-Pelagomonas_calceolata.AAC.4
MIALAAASGHAVMSYMSRARPTYAAGRQHEAKWKWIWGHDGLLAAASLYIHHTPGHPAEHTQEAQALGGMMAS